MLQRIRDNITGQCCNYFPQNTKQILLKILAIKTSIDYQAKEIIDTAKEAAGVAKQ